MAEIMDEMVEKLLRNKDNSETKSYLIGLERGRIWASDHADYFEMRQWSETVMEELDELVLPPKEDMHFKVLGAESPLELESYFRGWLEGVKEIAETY